jgi:3-phenylpropionate/cinnamic acid dioxygenase small subunit
VLSFEEKHAIEELLYREAHLLDEYRLDEWLTLFSEDVEYVIPLREHVQGDVPPAGHPFVRDNYDMLSARVAKFATGLSHVEVPRSMTTHLIGNIFAEESGRPGEVTVRSNFMVRQARKLRDEAWWVGRRTDTLRRVGDAWKIARREIVLDATVMPRGISIFF